MSFTRKSGGSTLRTHKGQHRFEHWYRDNQVYFITARCKGRFPAFAGDDAKAIFWQRFDLCTREHDFTPIVTSLIDNHYHTLGYLRRGDRLAAMMMRLHGSVAKLVNDELARRHRDEHPRPHGLDARGRLVPFWRDSRAKNYFDGCIRNEKQCRLTYRYICIQAERHRVVADWRTYPHTRIGIELEPAVERARALGAFLEGVPYKRYGRR